VLDHLDARAARRWAFTALGQLSDQRSEIDGSNVYPVADNDTGTNLLLTLQAGALAVQRLGPTRDTPLPDVAAAFARGALLGACGNSGAILAQLARGWADVLAEHPEGGSRTVTEALRRGAVQAYSAVSRPVEGTMLTIARAAGDGAVGATLAEVVTGAASAARTALGRTPRQLDVLARAGVVDAGGRGLLVLLDALAATVTGERALRSGADGVDRCPLTAGREPGGPAYEVRYLLEATADAVPVLRDVLDGLGDSTVVAGGGGLWTVHVHTDDVAGVLEAGARAGRPHPPEITRFDDPPPRPVHRRPVAVLATASGPGLVAALRAGGAAVVGDRPSRDELLTAVRDAGAELVVVLPSDPVTLARCRTAAARAHAEGQEVVVLATWSDVQVLAAIAVHDPTGPRAPDLARMAAVVAGTRLGWVSTADAAAVGWCRAGQMLGLAEGDLVAVGDDPERVALSVASRMLSTGGELLTLVWGAAPGAQGLASAVTRDARAAGREVEVCVVDGGQRGHALLLGLE